jgi:DNA-binding NarL/FixJ family response regulator
MDARRSAPSKVRLPHGSAYTILQENRYPLGMSALGVGLAAGSPAVYAESEMKRSSEAVSVWIVEDSADYRATVQELIELESDLECPKTFASAEDLLEHLNEHFAPEVILMDIGLPGINGLEAVRRVKGLSPTTQVVMLTIHGDSDRIFGAICAGASGYLTKPASPDAIAQAVRDVSRGGAAMTAEVAKRVLSMLAQVRGPRWDYQLTSRECDVLRALVDGKGKAQIAKSMFLSVHTIDTHIRNIYAKLHVHSRAAAVAKALKERLVEEVSQDQV